MSRGGRGGAAKNPLRQMGWDVDENVKLDSKPSALFPSYQVPFPTPSTEKEKLEIALFKGFRDEIHRGPFYTKPRKRDIHEPKIYGEDQDNARFVVKSKADFDPFNDGVPTFSKKYEQKQNDLPTFGQPFDKRFFPQELWATLEGKDTERTRADLRKNDKKLRDLIQRTPADQKARLDALVERLDKEEGEGDNDTVRDDEEAEEEEEDVDYEQDEAEMGGDYDAEQYFDGGDDDEEQDDGGGGGDDY